MSRPLDPRLLRATPALRPYLAYLGAVQILGAALIIAQAGLLASIIVGVFTHHDGPSAVLSRLVWLGGVGLARSGLSAVQEYVSSRVSIRVRTQLRARSLKAIAALGPGWAQRQESGRLTAATGSALDALDGYVTRALPALVSASVVPGAVLVWITITDWQSGVLFLLMLPLVPVFMALVGVTTKRRVQRQYALLARLSGHFLDLMRGLTTLTVYGQAARQEQTLRRATEQYRRETMAALRIAFLSALVMDLVAALSVAVVAVDVGLRLDSGNVSFLTALVVLLLAPELFAPLRAVGMQYHASQEGTAAAAAALDVIDEVPSRIRSVPLASLTLNGTVALDGVTVQYPGRDHPALNNVFLRAQPGEVVALVGRSGAGKSSLLSVLLGFVPLTAGQVVVGIGDDLQDLARLDPDRWRANVAWLPQRPRPTQPTVAAEIRLGDPEASDDAIARVARQCHTPAPTVALGEDGRSVSAGQRRRIALARVVLRAEAVRRAGGVALVLLDEPSEDLDHDTELVVAQVIASLAGWATVIIATHSELLAAQADRRVTIENAQIVANARQSRRLPSAVGIEAPAFDGPPEFELVDQAAPARLRIRDLIRREGLTARVLVAVALAGLAGTTGLALTGSSIWLISRAAQHPNVQALAIAVVGVRTFAIGRALTRYLERLTAHDVALRLLVGLRAQVFAALRPLGSSALGGYRRGDLLRRFVADVDGLQDGLVRAFVPFAGAVITSVAVCVLATSLTPSAGLILAVALALSGLLAPWAAGRLAGDGARLVELSGRREERTTAMADGLDELTAYGAVAGALSEVDALESETARAARRPALVAAAFTGLSGLVSALTLPAVLAAGAVAVHSGQLSVVSLGVLAVCVLVGFEAVAPLPSALAAWTRCRAGLARVAEVLAQVPPFVEPDASPVLAATDVGIRVRELTLRPAAGAPTVLTGAGLDLAAGRRMAVVGPSGSGKSSLLAAVLRQLPIERGAVEVSTGTRAVDLRSLTAADMPVLVAGSLQGDHVFDATLRDNLRVVRPDATDDQLDAVAARVGLAGLITSLPRGWASPAGPDGAALSGGQRQRLLLARALLADPAVLVLDEPTAHLDADTEQEVLADLLSATSGRTVLISTHRRLSADQVDGIVRIAHGRLEPEPQPMGPDQAAPEATVRA